MGEGLWGHGFNPRWSVGRCGSGRAHCPCGSGAAFPRLGMPEEVNRVLCDRMSSVLVCPTDAAVQHLGAEGIVDSPPIHRPSPVHPRVLRMGDVMHDNVFTRQAGGGDNFCATVMVLLHESFFRAA